MFETGALVGKATRLSSSHRAGFAQITADTRRGFAEVIDLILIHNERDVRGTQPRTTLNRLIAFLSVAAWERFVADVGDLARSPDPANFVPGSTNSQGFNKITPERKRNGGESKAVSTLRAATGGRLPDDWRILVTTSGAGKNLRFGYAARYEDQEMCELVDWWIEVRHKLAHRALPQLLEWSMWSDATASGGRTINTTLARSAFTLFLQLADQSIRSIAEAAQFEHPGELWLPEDWLTGRLPPQRGVIDPGRLHLWRGRSLAR